MNLSSIALILASYFAVVSAFVAPKPACVTNVALNGWMDAFKNDESLGKPQNAGLSVCAWHGLFM